VAQDRLHGPNVGALAQHPRRGGMPHGMEPGHRSLRARSYTPDPPQ
jgi:hypothetical protein